MEVPHRAAAKWAAGAFCSHQNICVFKKSLFYQSNFDCYFDQFDRKKGRKLENLNIKPDPLLNSAADADHRNIGYIGPLIHVCHFLATQKFIFGAFGSEVSKVILSLKI